MQSLIVSKVLKKLGKEGQESCEQFISIKESLFLSVFGFKLLSFDLWDLVLEERSNHFNIGKFIY